MNTDYIPACYWCSDRSRGRSVHHSGPCPNLAHQRESSPMQAAESPGIGRSDAKEVPMSDERLNEIEESVDRGYTRCGDNEYGGCIHHEMADELIAEVRRLRRENGLLHLSRGSAPLVGMD